MKEETPATVRHGRAELSVWFTGTEKEDRTFKSVGKTRKRLDKKSLPCDKQVTQGARGQPRWRPAKPEKGATMASKRAGRQTRIPSFEASIRKAMGRKWDRLSPADKEVVRELSDCEKGGGRVPLEESQESSR